MFDVRILTAAGGMLNVGFWMLDERERSNPLRRAKHIFNSKFKIAFGHAGYGCAGFSQVR